MYIPEGLFDSCMRTLTNKGMHRGLDGASDGILFSHIIGICWYVLV